MARRVAALLFTGLLMGMCASPAGAQSIVFASDRDGTFDIWKMNPDGSGQVKIAGSAAAHEFSPAISPDGTKIAFVRGLGATNLEPEGEIVVMNSDGTGETVLASSANDPAWSPDGTKIAFGSIGHSSRDGELWTMNADGGGQTPVASIGRDNLGPSWSSDGQRIAFHAQLAIDPADDGIWTVDPDGSDLVQLTVSDEGSDRDADWSPDNSTIAFSRDAIWSMNFDGTSQSRMTDGPDFDPAWSPDGAQIAFHRIWSDFEIYRVNVDLTGLENLSNNPASDIDADWGLVSPPQGYARPKGATPFRVSLAIAYRSCTTPNRTHGPPLAFGSCHPPQQASNFLTVGTADANAKPALNEGYVRLDALPGVPGGIDDADVAVDFFMDDVFTKPSLGDYSGTLRTHLTIRLTDRDLDGQPSTGTTEIELAFDSPCSEIADPQEGSACSLSTTAEAVVPGAVKEGKRAIWGLGRVEVYDGGADGNGATADNTLLATQGVFIP